MSNVYGETGYTSLRNPVCAKNCVSATSIDAPIIIIEHIEPGDLEKIIDALLEYDKQFMIYLNSQTSDTEGCDIKEDGKYAERCRKYLMEKYGIIE